MGESQLVINIWSLENVRGGVLLEQQTSTLSEGIFHWGTVLEQFSRKIPWKWSVNHVCVWKVLPGSADSQEAESAERTQCQVGNSLYYSSVNQDNNSIMCTELRHYLE